MLVTNICASCATETDRPTEIAGYFCAVAEWVGGARDPEAKRRVDEVDHWMHNLCG